MTVFDSIVKVKSKNESVKGRVARVLLFFIFLDAAFSRQKCEAKVVKALFSFFSSRFLIFDS
jgi:hypothetical protein